MIKNLKKVISTLAAVAILATSASAFAVSFPDVDANASYAGAVDALTTLGVVNGDDNGLFNPENTVTRAEFAKMVVEALGAGSEAASSTDTKFVDAKGHWAAGYIEVGVAKQFINGYDEKTFGPDDKVTYAQAVKMLVAAIGYESYASKQGGWPSGYLAYGSQLDIIAGVTGVANDTALTRAQCAVLVYNTLKAPICVINGYNQEYNGSELVWIPKLEEMNGEEGRPWKTLLTTKHDAYVVKGRVMGSVTVDAVKGNTVPFQVELAENFEGEFIKAEATSNTTDYTDGVKGDVDITAYVGNSKAADMLFTYSEAIIQKDNDTSEYTIVSITPYGAAKTVEFAAKDIKTAYNTSYEIEVKKDNTTKTNDYKVGTATDSADLYVNGLYVGPYASNTTIAPIDANKVGTVTLIRTTDIASTSADDVYDYVMVDYYMTGAVGSVDADDEVAIIEVTGKGTFTGGTIEIDLEEESEQSIKFIKDGAEISYTDLKEDDILSIAYKYNSSDWTQEDLKIFVSDKTVAGTITGKNATKETITVDGTVYDYAMGSYQPGTDVTLYLDAFGYVVDKEVNASNKTLGIVSAVYATGGEYKVKLITVDGELVTYNAKGDDATAIMNAIKTSGATASTAAEIFAKDITAPQKAVIEYKVDANGYVKMKSGVTAVETVKGGTAKKYSEELSMLGGYTISETATKIVALGKHFTVAGGSVSAMTMDQLEDEAAYDVYVCNDNDGVYGFAIITGDLAAIRPTSALAVVTATGTTTTVNDETVDVVTVAVNGEEDVDVYFKNASALNEGDVIMYRVGTEGYVEPNADTDKDTVIDEFNCIVLHSAATTNTVGSVTFTGVNAMYSKVFEDAATVADFTAKIANTNIVADADGFTIDVNGSVADGQDEDVEIFYGPVYTATENSLRIFTGKAATATVEGVPYADYADFSEDVETFSIGNANVYSYNYNKIADEGLRVSVAGLSQDRDFFKAEKAPGFKFTKVVDADKNITFGARVQPRMALVRVVDNVVTDVVYYRAK